MSEYGIGPGSSPALRSPGHGVWRREQGWQDYSFAFTYYRYDASGVFIGSHVSFTNDRYPRSLRPDGRLKEEGDFNLECTIVGYSASIGAGAVILPGVRIGSYAMIGAGAVVTGNVPEHALMIGNPARLVGYVCRCGKPLKLTRQTNTWQCESCHESYVFRP